VSVGKREIYKYQFEMHVRGITGLDSLPNEAATNELAIHVGKHGKLAPSRGVRAEGGCARWDETLTIVSTLYKSKKHGRTFSEKIFRVSLMALGACRAKHRRLVELAHAQIDIGDFAVLEAGAHRTERRLHLSGGKAASSPASSAMAGLPMFGPELGLEVRCGRVSSAPNPSGSRGTTRSRRRR
jgi:hypothetical protein